MTTDNLSHMGFEFCPTGIAVSQHRIIKRCNESFASLFGFSVKELEGSSFALLYPSIKDFKDIGKRGLEILLQTPYYSNERIMKRANGELFWCRARGRSLIPRNPFEKAVWTFEEIPRRVVSSDDLSPRESQVAVLLCAGQTSKEIALNLGISPRTVEAHSARIKKKLGVRNNSELVAKTVGLPL